MNRETTEKLTSRSPRDPDAEQNKWETPPPIFTKLEADFGPFDVDMTADESNHLCPDWVGPGSRILGGDWSDILTALPFLGGKYRSGYSNPIYHYQFVNALIPLCAEAAADKGFAATLLLPLRTTSEWWQYLLANQHNARGAAEILTCDKRICFYEDGHPRWNAKELAKGNYRADSAVFDSVIVVFRPPATGVVYPYATQFTTWEVPPHVPKSQVVIL